MTGVIDGNVGGLIVDHRHSSGFEFPGAVPGSNNTNRLPIIASPIKLG
jgi:hypothetical protein